MILTRRLTDIQDERIAQMDELTAPLFWAVYLAAFVVIAVTLANDYADYKHRGSRHNENMFAECLNGGTIKVDDVSVGCVSRLLEDK